MKMKPFVINHIPSLLWGEASNKIYVYIHGQHGYKEEAQGFAKVACAHGWQV